MISFRYHVVSLTAVLLALAVGVVLGAGPLQRPVAADQGEDRETLAAAEQRVGALERELAYAESYAASSAPRLLRAVLAERAVTLVVLPGADDRAVAGVERAVEQADGSVAARLRLTAKLLDVANRQLVATLAAQMRDSAGKNARAPADAGGYEQVGALLAHAVASRRPAGRPVDESGDSILAGLTTAGLVRAEPQVRRRGSLVVMVTGDTPTNADGADTVAATLAAALDAGSDGAVVAGPPGAGRADGTDGTDGALGAVSTIRADPDLGQEVSTVDVVDRAGGAAATALALAAQARGTTGHYGTSAAPDGPLPAMPGAR